MSTVAAIAEPRIRDLRITDSEITAFLVDGRTASVPLAWSYRRLTQASDAQRQHWELLGDGVGAHWPGIDERDIGIHGMLYGTPSTSSGRPPDQAVARS
ncbi:MAG: DUF2442 domain-containing protein [Comamonadaceae bacterium]|nr:DUF2442 domain-containing protein [Comamonadaceae bacterium]